MSPIKVLGVSGSPRKGKNTGSLLQGDKGWRRASGDALALKNARGVGRRVAEVARALRGTTRAE
jgi:hypothetical protein